MKRILFLVAIALLVSCNNQQEPKEKTTEVTPDGVQQALEAENNIETEPGTVIVRPEEVDPATMEASKSEGGHLIGGETANLFRQGTNAYEMGEFEDGIELFRQIVAKEPDNGRAYYNLGVGYFKIDKYGESIKAFTEAINISPRDSLSIQYRGRVYYMMGDFRNCLNDYDRVVQLKPEDPVAYYNRGTARGRNNDYEGAVKDFDAAIELDPEYSEAYYNRGLANFYRGYMHEACFDWRKAHTLGHYDAEKAIRAYCEGAKDTNTDGSN